jgi:hypothetical protein
MNLLNLRWILLIGLLVGSVLAEDVSADRPAKKFSAADLFNLVGPEKRPFTPHGIFDR